MQKPPEDFLAYELCLKEPRRYTRVGKDDWCVMRWHGGWVHTHNVGDAEVEKAFRMANYVFVPSHQAEASKRIEELEAKVARLEGTSSELLARCREWISLFWLYEALDSRYVDPELQELLDATKKTVQEATKGN